MPRVDIVQKHNTAARRLYIKGHNGKVFSFSYIEIFQSGIYDHYSILFIQILIYSFFPFPPAKIYPYLVLNDSCLSDARKEERVLQLLRMLNHYLGKQKETSKRFLNFTVPRVVPVSPQLRLIEDNESSVSLLDIYKQVSSNLFRFFF